MPADFCYVIGQLNDSQINVASRNGAALVFFEEEKAKQYLKDEKYPENFKVFPGILAIVDPEDGRIKYAGYERDGRRSDTRSV